MGRALDCLITGRSVRRADLSAATSAALDALLSEQARQQLALERIEAKLDRMLVQDFRRPYDTGRRLLQSIAVESNPAAQRQLCHDARLRFIEASAGTTDPFEQAMAEHAAAVCALLEQKPRASLDSLDRAWATGYAALQQCLEEWSPARQNTLFELAKEMVGSRKYYFSLSHARTAVRPKLVVLDPLLSDVLELRRLFGTPLHAAPLLDIGIGGWELGSDNVVVVMKMHQGRVELPDGVRVEVHDVDVLETPRYLTNRVRELPVAGSAGLEVTSHRDFAFSARMTNHEYRCIAGQARQPLSYEGWSPPGMIRVSYDAPTTRYRLELRCPARRPTLLEVRYGPHNSNPLTVLVHTLA